jgi:hypothetical protein
MRTRTFGIILLYGGLTSLCGAQLSVPPAANRVSPKIDAKRAALLLPDNVAARQIVLYAQTAAERAAAVVPKAAGKTKATPKSAALQIGFPRSVPASDQSIALAELRWQAVDGDTQTARVTITSSGAAALRLGMQLGGAPADLRVRFIGSSATAEPFGPYTAADVAAQEVFWSPVLEGETATLELALPTSAAVQGALEIAKLSHLEAAGAALSSDVTLKALGIGTSESCEVDVACLSADLQALAQSAVNATARLLITTDGATYLCTGTLLNDGISSNTPYFYTANHCLDNTGAPGDTKGLSAAAVATNHTYGVFQAASCGSHETPEHRLLAGGSDGLGRSVDYDWALVRLNTPPPAAATFAGWNAGGPLAVGTAVIGIHHPKGDLKKLSQGNTTEYDTESDGSSFIQVGWTSGVTEPGSSGSGLFTFNSGTGAYELRGGLWGGGSDCSTPRLTDTYSRLDVGYPLIQDYLAPAAVRANGEVAVVEFYNATLNDYFITADPNEVADLDTGVHAGWVRTGLRFLGYADAVSAPSGAVPVCRFYVRPQYGDSHFYSADVAECAATLAKFADSWVYESPAVFYILLPNVTTGSCPSGMKSVYRFYNSTNAIHHRYTTEIDVRDDLLAHGLWKEEGYGAGPPNQVVMCAPAA